MMSKNSILEPMPEDNNLEIIKNLKVLVVNDEFFILSML